MNLSLHELQNILNNVDTISIDEIKYIMEINDLKPIQITDSNAKDLEENQEATREFFEFELREKFAKFIQEQIDLIFS